MTHLLNFITFQIWAGLTLAGLVVSLLTGDWWAFQAFPWAGLFAGVCANEALGPGNCEVVKIV